MSATDWVVYGLCLLALPFIGWAYDHHTNGRNR